jgi:hypothetical protein
MADEYGVKIWNDSGSVQIDSTYRNIAYIKTIRVTDLGSTGWAEIPIEDDKWYVIEPRMFSNTTSSAFLESYLENPFRRTLKVSYPVLIHEFGFVNVPTQDTFGFQVFNAEGQLSFDSSFRPFKVLDHIFGTVTNQQIDSNDTVTLLSKNYGRRIGFCVSRQIQVTGYVNNVNFYNKCLFFTGRDNGNAIVQFKTAYTSWPKGDTGASTTLFSDSTIRTYEFSVVDCSFLPQ